MESYGNKVLMYKLLVQKTYPSYNVDLYFNDLGTAILHLKDIKTGKEMLRSITETSTWSSLKTNIDASLNGKTPNGEMVCCKCYLLDRKIPCSECTLSMCPSCYIDTFRKGKGIITCPNCSVSYGRKWDNVEEGISIIKARLGF